MTTGSSTENGVTQHSGSCKKLTFIFARGTTEIGNMGTVVGPEVASELATLTGNQVTVQGVNYPADWEVRSLFPLLFPPHYYHRPGLIIMV